MPQAGGRKRRSKKTKKGKGFWDDVKSGFQKVGSVVKDSGVVSNVLAPMIGGPWGSVASNVARSAGWGQRRGRKRGRGQTGGAMASVMINGVPQLQYV